MQNRFLTDKFIENFTFASTCFSTILFTGVFDNIPVAGQTIFEIHTERIFHYILPQKSLQILPCGNKLRTTWQSIKSLQITIGIFTLQKTFYKLFNKSYHAALQNFYNLK